MMAKRKAREEGKENFQLTIILFFSFLVSILSFLSFWVLFQPWPIVMRARSSCIADEIEMIIDDDADEDDERKMDRNEG